jgi:hypothetical protein
LIGEATQRLAGDAVETREIDAVLVVGKSEPERIFEVLGRKGEVAAPRLELAAAFAAGLAAYRSRAWDAAIGGFEACLALDPEDSPSRVFLARVMRFREYAPADDWDGVWALEAK